MGKQIEPRPRLALVSTGIRRDLLGPIRFFRRFEIVHLYRRIEYGDLTEQDLDSTLRRYTTPFSLYRTLIALRPSLIQSVEPLSLWQQPFVWASYWAAQRLGARFMLVTLENRPLEYKFNPLVARLLCLLLRPVFASACLIVAVNHGAEQNLRRCVADASKIVRLMWGTWGIDPDEFSPAQDLLPHPPTLLYAGRLAEEKGIFVLLEALAKARARVPNVQLLVVGDGPSRQALAARLRELGLEGSVELRGVVKNREMPALMRQADVLAAPSLTTRKWAEQVGMSILQALASGLPVVASSSGAIPEYVPNGTAGILVPEGDAFALASAIVDLLTNPERRAAVASAARAYACAHYDAAANVRAAEDVVWEQCFENRV